VEQPSDRHGLELYLIRHADAGDPSAWSGDDTLRPLSEQGRRDAQSLGRFLATRRFAPDAIISSPRLRALQTAELMAGAMGMSVSPDGRLAEPLDLDALEAIVESAPGRRVVIVGHDPDLSELASALTGAAYLPLRKSALARIDVSLPLQPAGGILRWLLPPEVVAAD
jgi:phosphohistidine phosphatase